MIFACYQRFHRKLCLFLLVLLGLACGQLAATLLGSSLRGQAGPTLAALPLSPSSQTPPQNELGFILQHNPFNSAARSATPVSFSLQDSSVGAGVAARGDLELLGTIVAGSRSAAVIRLGQEVQNFHLGEEIPGGAIEEILRNQVSIRNHDRSLTILSMERIGTNAAQAASEAGTASAESAQIRTPPSATAKGGVASNAVRSAGANRWIIARSAAEAARENIGEQLRTALIQPNLVNGKTDGFVVRRIQRGTLLAQMGLQRGDVIKRVNRMPLDSPEKALQILQQLREARQLSVDLERAGTPLSFAYEIE